MNTHPKDLDVFHAGNQFRAAAGSCRRSYKAPEPEGHIVARTSCHVNAVILRGFLVDGKTDASMKMFKEGLKIYSLSKPVTRPRWRSAHGRRPQNGLGSSPPSSAEHVRKFFHISRSPVSRPFSV
jgi:hypothetical protein